MEIEESWEDDWPEDADDDEVLGEGVHDADVVACPLCGADVYEDAEQCPTCGEYIVHTSANYAWSNRPAWWIVLGLIGIVAVILTLALGP